MELITWLLKTIRNPDALITLSGYPLALLALVIFLETGAMVFFLPGDSLLVTAGIYAATGSSLSLLNLNLALIPAAILGDAISYYIGKKTGPHIFNRPRSRFFNPAHLKEAHDFYERHGGKTIIIARFMPILRTFVPVVAGVAQMTYRRFVVYNVVGAASWVLSMTCIGYFLGQRWPGAKDNVEKIIIVVVFLSILPGLIAWLRVRFSSDREVASELNKEP
jgi:membrane-associated protein